MTELEVQGIDIEEAIKKGLALLNTERENIIIKILDEGRPGLFGLEGAKPARVKLLPKQDLPVNFSLSEQRSKEIIEKILQLMGAKFELSVVVCKDQIEANIFSDDFRLIIGEGGQTLDALQKIVILILHQDPQTRVRLIIDCNNYRANQIKQLVQLTS